MRAFDAPRSRSSFEMSTESSALTASTASTSTQYYNITPYKEYIGVTSGRSSELGYGRSMSTRQIEEIQKSWLLHPREYGGPHNKTLDLGFFICKKGILAKILYAIFLTFLVAGFVAAIVIFAPRKHHRPPSSDNYTLALHQALLFFDAQKSGPLNASTTRIEFRGDSGLKDGHFDNKLIDLVGGYYDSGNNIKFGFTTAYTITLISWSVIEYSDKYEALGELDHVKDIIKWGTDYLLKSAFDLSAQKIDTIYSQVGSATNDLRCWQRPEDMDYERPVSECKGAASDLAGEIAAALAAASIVFQSADTMAYSAKLVRGAQKLYEFANGGRGGRYTDTLCGAGAVDFYNSSGYYDELVWGGSWVFFATGNWSYLQAVTEVYYRSFGADSEGVFSWNNKLLATQLLLTRLKFFVDPGYPYEKVLKSSTETIEITMCSYLQDYTNFDRTPGGLILLRPSDNEHLQYAATSAFLSKLYSDYLSMIGVEGWTCGPYYHRSQELQDFSASQIDYILGKNPMNMSYVVGFGRNYPRQVHHRAASIPSISIDKHRYGCTEGQKWLNDRAPNPNILNGSMVAGPSFEDDFSDDRTKKNFTQPTIAANAGLVAALVAQSMPMKSSRGGVMIDRHIMFSNIHPNVSTSPSPSTFTPPPWNT